MNRFPLYNENDFAIAIETNLDIDKEHADLIAKGMKRVIGLFAEDKHNREILKVAPDTTGADKYFVDNFITPEMADDFWIIAGDFMQHHFPRLREFNELAIYDNERMEQLDSVTALQNRIMNIIYNAAKSGDAYLVELILIRGVFFAFSQSVECSSKGVSLYVHQPNGKVADAFRKSGKIMRKMFTKTKFEI